MDAYDIALLMANQDPARPLKMRYGTVADNTGNLLQVVPDGQTTPIPAIRCCHAAIDDRIILLVAETEWIALASIGGGEKEELPLVELEVLWGVDPRVDGSSVYYQLFGKTVIVTFKLYGLGTVNQNVVFGTMPDRLRPPTNMTSSLTMKYTDGRSGVCEVQESGLVFARVQTDGTYVGQVAYVAC